MLCTSPTDLAHLPSLILGSILSRVHTLAVTQLPNANHNTPPFLFSAGSVFRLWREEGFVKGLLRSADLTVLSSMVQQHVLKLLMMSVRRRIFESRFLALLRPNYTAQCLILRVVASAVAAPLDTVALALDADFKRELFSAPGLSDYITCVVAVVAAKRIYAVHGVSAFWTGFGWSALLTVMKALFVDVTHFESLDSPLRYQLQPLLWRSLAVFLIEPLEAALKIATVSSLLSGMGSSGCKDDAAGRAAGFVVPAVSGSGQRIDGAFAALSLLCRQGRLWKGAVFSIVQSLLVLAVQRFVQEAVIAPLLEKERRRGQRQRFQR